MTQWTDEWTGFDRKFTHLFLRLVYCRDSKKYYTKKSQNYPILSGFIISLQTITVTAAQLDLPGVWEDKQTRGKGRQRSLNRRWWGDHKLWPTLLTISVFDVNYVSLTCHVISDAKNCFISRVLIPPTNFQKSHKSFAREKTSLLIFIKHCSDLKIKNHLITYFLRWQGHLKSF